MSRLAIITICRNDRAGLERTFANLDAQTEQGFDHVVIDGASTDGSIDLIRERAHRLFFWVSEPDEGIYSAQNKGWRAAKADFILFLNSGDALDGPDVIARALPMLTKDVDLAYGDARLSDARGPYAVKHHPERITSAWLMKGVVAHQAQFIRRSLLERMGGYDQHYRIAADYDLFARAFWSGGLRLLKLPFIVGVFDTGGLSSRPDQMARFAQDRKEIHRRHAPRFWFAVYYAWARLNKLIGR